MAVTAPKLHAPPRWKGAAIEATNLPPCGGDARQGRGGCSRRLGASVVKLAPDHLSRTNFSIRLASETDFAGWRNAARDLALADIAPEAVTWHVGEAGDLFGTDAAPLPRPVEGRALTVPRAFVERAEAVICHSDPERFSFLYRMLWRQIAEPKLLSVASDPDVIRLQKLEKAVRRDIHKMRAFSAFISGSSQCATSGICSSAHVRKISSTIPPSTF